MSAVRTCPACGTILSADAPQGLCGACLPFQGQRQLDPTIIDPQGNTAEQIFQRGERVRYFGDYELLGIIASGGMGVVYKARQISLNRMVALKMIRSGGLATTEEVQRFRTEAEAAANLDHPNIVPIYEIGEYEGRHYFSMRLIQGDSLATRLGRKRLPIRDAVKLMVTICHAVHHAHQRGVLHRDLKPSNILLDHADQPNLTDFGLAKFLEHDAGFTRSEAVLGTPHYMAPEQAAGRTTEITTATDIYGLGAILFELLTGKFVFDSESPIEALRRAVEDEPCSPRKINRKIDRDLETISLKCLQKAPELRYSSAHELATELERWFRGEPIVARPVGPLTHLARWARRRPAIAALMVLSATAVVAFGVISSVYNQRLREKSSYALKQRDRVERTLSQLHVENSIRLMNSGDIPQALAYLAQVVRNDPSNHTAVEWLTHALASHNYAVPAEPLRHDATVQAAAFAPNGRLLATVSDDFTIRVWEVTSGKLLFGPLKHKALVTSLAFSKNDQLLTSSSLDGTVHIWDLRTNASDSQTFRTLSAAYAAMLSGDGLTMTTVSSKHEIQRWDVTSGKETEVPIKAKVPIYAAQFSADGMRLLTLGTDKTVRTWKIGNGISPLSAFPHDFWVRFAEFDPDGRRVMTVAGTNSICIWEAATGRPVCQFTSLAALVHSAKFSPDGARVITTSEDRVARIWDALRGDLLLTLEGHRLGVSYGEFSSDGLRVLTASEDQSVRVWDSFTGCSVTVPIHHDAPVVLGRFAPAHNRVATFVTGGAVRLWELQNSISDCSQTSLESPISWTQKRRPHSFSEDDEHVGPPSDQPIVTNVLSGIVVFKAISEVDYNGFPLQGIHLSNAPEFMRNQEFESLLSLYLGKPISERTIKNLQHDIINHGMARGELAVSVFLPDQEISGGVIQLTVLHGTSAAGGAPPSLPTVLATTAS